VLIAQYKGKLVWVLAMHRNKNGDKAYDVCRHGQELNWPDHWPYMFTVTNDGLKEMKLSSEVGR